MSRRAFKQGDKVIVAGKTAIVERVEKENKTLNHITIDRGRYTIRYEDGSLHLNAPGYILARPGEIHRR